MVIVAKRKPKPPRKVFDGVTLRELRQAGELTQKQLADAVGIHLIDVSRYERGEVQPSLAVGAAIAAFFRVPVERLLRDADGG